MTIYNFILRAVTLLTCARLMFDVYHQDNVTLAQHAGQSAYNKSVIYHAMQGSRIPLVFFNQTLTATQCCQTT